MGAKWCSFTFFKSVPDNFVLPNPKLGPKESLFISQGLSSLESCGAIAKCVSVPYCVSPIHCVPPQSKDYRSIVTLKHLNSHCGVPKFRYHDINNVLDYVQNGFYHIPVRKEFQCHLGVCWQGVCYVWRVLPFGLPVSPYYFNKCLRPVIEFIWDNGSCSSVYVDDFIVASRPEWMHS